MIRCCTSWRAPTSSMRSPTRRWPRSTGWSRAIRTAATSTRRNSAAASCCSRTSPIARAQSRLRSGHQIRAGVRVLQSKPLQARLVPVQARRDRAQPGVLRRACSIRCCVSKGDPKKLIEIDTLSRANRELVEDTFRVMSITFSYSDGPKTIDEFVKHREPPRPTITCCTRASAICTSRRSATRTPPTAIARSSRRTATTRRRRFSRCRPSRHTRRAASRSWFCRARRNSSRTTATEPPYWQGRTPQGEPKVVAELKTNLKDVAQYYHAEAQRTKNVADYQEAAKWYRSYLTSFPDDPDSAVTNFLLAETLVREQVVSRCRAGVREHRLRLRRPRRRRRRRVMRRSSPTARRRRRCPARPRRKMHGRGNRQLAEVRAGISAASGKRAGADARRDRSVRREGLCARHGRRASRCWRASLRSMRPSSASPGP